MTSEPDHFSYEALTLSYGSKGGHGYGNQKRRGSSGFHGNSQRLNIGDTVDTGAPSDRWYKKGRVIGMQEVGQLGSKYVAVKVQHDNGEIATYGERQLTKADENIDLPELLGNDKFALVQVQNFMSEGATVDQALKKYIDSVEGNASELLPKLAAYAQQRGMLDGWEYPQEP